MIKVVFCGTPQIAVASLEHLFNSDKIEVVGVVTQQDKPSGRGNKLTPPPIKVVAEKLGLPVFQPKSIRKEADIQEQLKKLNPDFFVTFAFGQILSQEVLDIPKYATINLHASLLPKYRGANPIQRCIYNGDKKTGITTMITVLELDAGDICKTEEIEITPTMTDVELATIISQKSPQLLETTLIDIVENRLTPIKQDETQVTFANKFVKADGLIDFSRTAKEIEHQIRSMYSWPNAFTFYNGKMLKILSGRATQQVCTKSAGEIISLGKNGIEVATSEGVLLITEVKPEGKGTMPACAWINGSGIKVGDKLE